jgi:hypothetical protein
MIWLSSHLTYYLIISDSDMWKRLQNVYSQIKQTQLLSQPIWQPPLLYPVSYQPPTHRRLLVFPVCVSSSWRLLCRYKSAIGIHSCLQCDHIEGRMKYTVERYPKKYIVKYPHTYEYEYHTSVAMQILISSTVSSATLFFILSSPYGCIKITSTQGRLYVPSVTSSMNSLSSSSFLDMDRTLFFRHRSWTWTEPYSFEKPLHKLDVTSRLLLWKQERRMCETMQSSHRLCPTMTLVHDSVRHCHLHLTFPWHVLKRLENFLKIE